MKITLVAFGIAKDILGTNQLQWNLEGMDKLGDLKSQLCERYPDFKKLRSLALAVNETYQTDDFTLSENDEVVIIPPVSGG